jgi:uncharacterized delta-60 repeat protein
MRSILTFIFIGLLPLLGLGAPGDLDPTFAAGGRATFAPTSGTDFARGVVVQTDGKIIIVGWSEPPGFGPSAYVGRFHSNGTADSSFGVNGFVFVPGVDSRAWAVTLQQDGKIVVAGSRYVSGNFDSALWRLNADGTFDATFGGSSGITVQMGFYSDEFYDVAIQPNLQIVAVGSGREDLDHDFTIARFNFLDGSLDTSFSSDGVVFTPMDAVNDAARGVALQPDGRIIVAGQGGPTTSTSSLAIARYNTDGSLDTTFDGDGKLLRNFSNSEAAFDVKVQADGKIVVGGEAIGIFSIMRFNPNGTTDFSFNGNGRSDFGFTASNARSIHIQQNGKILGAGFGHAGATRFIAVVRVNTDGSRDASFGAGNGFVTTDFGPSTNSEAQAAAIQPDGKLIAAGHVIGGSFPNWDIALARYETQLAPSASTVSVSGRVAGANGRGISSARVTLEDPSGGPRHALTNGFGYFSFEGVEVGRSYVVFVSHKRYEFAPRTVHVLDEVTDLVFVPWP